MRFLSTAVAEIVGLFVDDWAFAFLLVAWVVLFDLFGAHLPHSAAPFALFAGIAVLVLAFIVRKARAG